MAIRAVWGGRWGDFSLRRDMSRRGKLSRVFSACLALAVCFSSSTLSAVASAGSPTLNEDQLKAAYLYNFARYVRWPDTAHESSGSALEIGVVGGGAVSELLKKTVVGKKIEGRDLRVVDLSSPVGGRRVHILFIAGERDLEELEQVIADLIGTPVFAVSDVSGFAERGGIANFIAAKNRVRFVINKSAAKKAGLKVSSKLLRLADLVE